MAEMVPFPMIEPGSEHRRRSSIVLSSTKDHDCVGRLELLFSGVMHHGMGKVCEHDRQSNHRDQDGKNPDFEAGFSGSSGRIGGLGRERLDHPCAKNSEI